MILRTRKAAEGVAGIEMTNALIIGQGTLPIQCAKIFSQAGVVSAVCSPDEPLKQWANAAGVPHFHQLFDFRAFARENPFDYLLSIVNYKVLAQDLLHLPARMAINYHDGPLPRYGGVYVTTWAIMNGETTHGITWHVMTDRVDAGDILKQVTFPVSPDDTAYKLNLKCYYSAIHAFGEMMPELIAGTIRPQPQDLTQRTYFGKSKRPGNDALVSFEWPAEQIDRFCRALDFEGTPNPIGLPKIVIDGRLLVAPRVELTDTPSSLPPGHIVALTPALRVATSTSDVLIPLVQTLNGRALPVTELTRYGLEVGTCVQTSDLSAVTRPEQL